jgi:hypothetical protein
MTETPAWLEQGAPVVVVYGYDHHKAEETTVQRLTSRDVVLANGIRFQRASIHGVGLIHTPRSRKVVDYRFLVPPDHEEAVKVLRAQAERELKQQAEASAMVSGAVGATIHDTHAGEPITATWTRGTDPRTF